MAMTPAEKQRRYRERLKAKAAAGDEKAQQTINNNSKNVLFASAKSFIKLHATTIQLKELEKLIQKKLKKGL